MKTIKKTVEVKPVVLEDMSKFVQEYQDELLSLSECYMLHDSELSLHPNCFSYHISYSLK
jgi:hypothetical protein